MYGIMMGSMEIDITKNYAFGANTRLRDSANAGE